MNGRIVFMGTPAFAVASLDALVNAGFDIAAVVTAPDRPAGRGQQLRMSAVKEYALQHPLLKDRILQPEKLKDPAFHAQLDGAAASLYVVVAFRMLPEAVWNRPPLGTINLHASLLPDYRGAAPINWAVMNGERRTGVTTFFIRHEIDTGDMIAQESTDIGPEETAGDLHDRLKLLGAPLVVRTVRAILGGGVERLAQPSTGTSLRHAPKLTPENTRIDWTASAQQVHDHVRGLNPMPGAWTTMRTDEREQRFKILGVRIGDRALSEPPGSMQVLNDRIFVRCGDGSLELLELQPEGRRRMSAAEFVRGSRSTEQPRFQ